MKNLLSRIHTRWMRRRLALAGRDLAWMEREFPRRVAGQRDRVARLAVEVARREVAVSAAEVAKAVSLRAKRGVLA